MNSPPSKPKKSFVRKLLKIGLITILLLLLAVLGIGVFGVWYFGADRVKTLDNIAFFGGGSLSVGKIRVSNIWDYPEIDLTVHDLHVWEKNRTTKDSAFFVMNEGRIRLRADLFKTDTILVRQLSYKGGRLHLLKDDQNQNAAERMMERRPISEKKSRFKFLGSTDLQAGIDSVDFRLSNPGRGKLYAGLMNHVNISELSFGEQQNAVVDFDVKVNGLTFKQADGAFAKNTKLQGRLQLEYTSELLSVKIPDLLAGNTAISFEASVFSNPDSLTKLHFDLDAVNLEEVRPMLSAVLQEKIADYDVGGTFPAALSLYRNKKQGGKSIVELNLKLRGNRARIKQYDFDKVFVDGKFFNRIPESLKDYNPPIVGSTFVADTISATGFGFEFTATNTKVVSKKGEGSELDANIHAFGPSRSLSNLLNSDQYLFTKGEVEIQADVVGPLAAVTKLLDQSNGTMTFIEPTVELVEAGVQLPLKRLMFVKQDNRATVDLEGVTPSANHLFHVAGEVTGISKIIGGANKEPVQSVVRIESKHLTWEDLSAYLGTKFTAEAQSIKGNRVDANSFDPLSLKKVLTSIEASFQPKLDVAVDTFGYMDIVLTGLHTGMHFQGQDTMILERTSFLLDTAKVGFSGSLGLGEPNRTTYQFSLKAKHVDVAKLLPKVNYLNSKLLSEFNTLPDDVDVEIDQLGFFHDRDGILPNSSSGFIDLVSNKQKAFRARVDFEPDRPNDPSFNSTHVNLEGNGVLFNDFFDTEEFLFQDGDFDFYMAYAGFVPNLRSLIENEEMTLDFQQGSVLFKSADLEIPINSLNLNVLRDTASVQLFLRSEELDQELSVRGVANNLSEVVLGGSGKQFSTQAVVESRRIVWSDLNALIGTFSGDKDTTAELNLRKTTKAIMSKFRPDVQLKIDQLELNNYLSIQEVESGLRMDTSQRLFIDTTGFIYDKGSMKLAGSVDLTDLELTPFDLYVHTEELNAASMLQGFDYFGVASLKEAQILEGKVSLELNLEGDILGDGGKLVPETAKGEMSFSLFDLEVDGLQQLDDVASKFRMKKRLDDLKFATLTNVVSIDTNMVHLPLMEIPTSAFRVFIAGNMELGKGVNFWVSVPLANVKKPDPKTALIPLGYANQNYKVHLEFARNEELETKLRWSRRKYYKHRDELDKWKIDRSHWRAERKRARKKIKN